MEKIEEKLIGIINTECKYADENGSSKFSTCNNRNWDKDVWNFRNSIIETIKKRGYNVTTETNHGVLDITTTKVLKLG